MKRCPSCNRTYTDEILSYCLDDGTPLQHADDAPPSFDPQATISFQPGRDTTPPSQPSTVAPTIMSSQAVGVQPQSAAPPPPFAQPQQWRPGPQMPPVQKKRSALPWVFAGLIVLLLIAVGGIGLIGFLVYIGSQEKNDNKTPRNSNVVVVRPGINGNRNSSSSLNPSPTPPTEVASDLMDDFSSEKWRTGSDDLGRFWYDNDELHAHAVSGRYVVEYGPKEAPYYTRDSTVKMTLRSVEGESPKYGYGIVVHGQMKENQLEDYAFVIKSDADPAYTILLQKDGKETALVKWTTSSAIRTGTSPNQLEIRTKDDKLDFYINGQFVNSIVDTANFKTGLVGIYTSDIAEVAFDDLEVVH